MTLGVQCDNCGTFTAQDTHIVELNGISARSDILLPEYYMKKHFCTKQCFWKWVEANKP